MGRPYPYQRNNPFAIFYQGSCPDTRMVLLRASPLASPTVEALIPISKFAELIQPQSLHRDAAPNILRFRVVPQNYCYARFIDMLSPSLSSCAPRSVAEAYHCYQRKTKTRPSVRIQEMERHSITLDYSTVFDSDQFRWM